ncbi:MAG: tripartite tricarboxylate transporter substrate-binding protein [Vicinamibacterales bacterium]
MNAARLLLGVVLASPIAHVVSAQPLHGHLRLIAPAAPGGGWDQTARVMQAVLQEAGLVRTSSVENIPGAAGTIGLARFVSAERGNGDVLMLSGLIMLGAVVTHQSPVTLREVTPIARLLGEYEVVVVPTASPIRSLADLVDAFRARPESVSWGGGSAGGTDQILAGLFADAVGVSPSRVNYIAFSGGGESLSAILGGQVTVGVNGLAELAPHIEAGSVRPLAISSAGRLPGLDVPTFLEQGVDVQIENWRSVVAPPGVSAVERERLEQIMDAMVRSPQWQDALARYRWNDRYLAGTAFARFSAAEEARVEGILARLGTGGAAGSAAALGRYPLFVLLGLAACALWSARGMRQARRPAAATPAPTAVATGRPGAIALIALAAAIDLLLLERAGFIVASTALFWGTARAFDASRPIRDAAFALGVSVACYVVFQRWLELSLPAGWLAGWL